MTRVTNILLEVCFFYCEQRQFICKWSHQPKDSYIYAVDSMRQKFKKKHSKIYVTCKCGVLNTAKKAHDQ